MHRWSPLHELIPETPLRHGHAISIDMAFSATLANKRGLLPDTDHHRLLKLFSRAGLSIDHPQFDEQVLDKGTAAILKTRDGSLRLAVTSPLGSCAFINDVDPQELKDALRKHKSLAKTFPREGAGIEAHVDSSDTGYTDLAAENRGVNHSMKAAGAKKPNGAQERSIINKAPCNGLVNGRDGDTPLAISSVEDGIKAQA